MAKAAEGVAVTSPRIRVAAASDATVTLGIRRVMSKWGLCHADSQAAIKLAERRLGLPKVAALRKEKKMKGIRRRLTWAAQERPGIVVAAATDPYRAVAARFKVNRGSAEYLRKRLKVLADLSGSSIARVAAGIERDTSALA